MRKEHMAVDSFRDPVFFRVNLVYGFGQKGEYEQQDGDKNKETAGNYFVQTEIHAHGGSLLRLRRP